MRHIYVMTDILTRDAVTRLMIRRSCLVWSS